ncbi:alpha/beta fold hydrolase [Actinoalloteichus hymeniacidonis]|uniref:Hydrolase or acyltransferase of alpha/beta superfamily n=1 Tax=Actinoalloteichus hymeniacidonis TaxID=340345 RepID=A0AAC9HUL2_9PSEU|nr:alpha/beta hydrolase [Actinoalloteichus hymeniacidonis]AOS65748.1 putative hydrolase or acyltransferase of alpha/beta superfamily [Actinoalloteichus hymeniacidonis]MBB5906162.1 pimeloyl-ACP methyl ester carboxylesterase [Actinoalloteichus hymeniacidonis]
MKPWHVVGMVGGLVGAALGAAVGVAAHSAKLAAQREQDADPLAEEALGALEPDREYTVAADDGLPIVVEEVNPADGGAAELTVVLVHGYVLDRRCWHFQRRDLPLLTDPRVRVISYDQRSHGRSGRGPTSTSTIEQLGRDLAGILRVAAPTGPLVLVGHSMGGMTVMALAEQYPELFVERIKAVALVGTAAGELARSGLAKSFLNRRNPMARSVGRVAAWQPGLFEMVRRAGGGITRSGVRSIAFGDRKVHPRLVDLMVEMINGTPLQVVTDFLETLSTHDRVTALVGLRHCHVLVLAGDADRITPFWHSEVIARELPDAEFVRVAGAGHMVMLEQPEQCTEAIRQLIRQAHGERRTPSARQRIEQAEA